MALFRSIRSDTQHSSMFESRLFLLLSVHVQSCRCFRIRTTHAWHNKMALFRSTNSMCQSGTVSIFQVPAQAMLVLDRIMTATACHHPSTLEAGTRLGSLNQNHDIEHRFDIDEVHSGGTLAYAPTTVFGSAAYKRMKATQTVL